MISRLLDTSICVHLIRGRSSTLLSCLTQCPVGSVGISTITLAELQYGVAKSSDPSRNGLALKRFCMPLEILKFDQQAATTHGEARSRLERVGTPIGPLDTLSAAHALSLDVILVTSNEDEIRRVAGLKVENWRLS